MSAKSDEALLIEIRERFDYASTEWADIRKDGAKDMRYVAGDPWEPTDRQLREDAGRPCLSLDELGQHFNQVINDVRANPRSPKFSPVGNGANDDNARFYADKWREIEYRSHAQIAYIGAFENCIQRSYGFARVNTRYESDRSFNLDLWIEDLPNPDMVLPDPDARRPDSSDMKYCFVYETWQIAEFKKQYPRATVTDFESVRAQAPSWIKGKTILLAEYWTIETTASELLLLRDPHSQQTREVLKHELAAMPAGWVVVKKRPVDVPTVVQYLTNGIEILKTTPWPGKYIPIVSCYGKVIYVDRGSGPKRTILSMTRLARDPEMLYCYYRTQQAEIVGMIPKAPVMAYKGQFRGVENDWQKAPHEPVAFLEANATTEETGAQILPLPTRLAYEAGSHLQALELCAEGARRAIMSAMGLTNLPTSAQRQNEKSGVALKNIDKNQQKGSFHYVDHYNDMLRQLGVIGEDLMDKVYDSARDVGIRKQNDKAEIVRINDPQAVDRDGKARPISTKGDYIVTVSVGQTSDSERDAATEFVNTLVGSKAIELVPPPLRLKLLAAAIRLKNLGSHGDEMADLLDPPDAQGHDPKQQLAQAKQMVEQLHGELQQASEIIKTDKIKADAAKDLKTMDLEFQKWKAELDAETKIAVAELGAKIERLTLFLEERARLSGRVQEEQERQHEAALTTLEHQQALEAGQQAQDHALAQGDQSAAAQADLAAQGHQQTLEQGQQAADLAPQPEAGP